MTVLSKEKYITDLEQWKKGFTFFHEVKVRFSETDMFGHLNNTVPFAYFEEARIEYFKHLGFMSDWTNPLHDTIPVVADLQCDYLKQIFFDEKLKVYVKAETIGNSSVDIHYMAIDEHGRMGFTGRGTVVQISRHTGKGVAWTAEMKTLFMGEKSSLGK